jgi:hypothetical protein
LLHPASALHLVSADLIKGILGGSSMDSLEEDEWQEEEKEDEERRNKAERGYITISVEAVDCLLHHPDALLLYLWYCKNEQLFPGRLIRVGYVNEFAWVNKPFSKGKLINNARGILLKYGLLRVWINEDTKKFEYYQTKFEPRADLELVRFGAPWLPDTVYFNKDTLEAYKAAHPPLIPE